MSLAGKKLFAGDLKFRVRRYSAFFFLLITLMSVRVGNSFEAKVMAAKADIRGGLYTALDMFEIDCGRYPTTTEGLAVLVGRPSDIATNRWHGPYLDKKPFDPWGREYAYRCPATHSTNDYEIYSCGPDKITKSDGADPDDINSWDASSPQKEESDYSFLERLPPPVILIFILTAFIGVVRFGTALFSKKVRVLITKRPALHLIWFLATLVGLYLLQSIILTPRI